MKYRSIALMLAVFFVATTGAAIAQESNPMVGGAAMYRTRDIVDNAVNSADHTTLVAAVKAAGLVSTLKGKGPFTVFAPTNEAFAELPAGTVDNLLKPENKEMLTKVLTYHVVAGNYDSKALMALVKKGNGAATLKTVSGGTLTLSMGSSMESTHSMGGMKSMKTITVRDEKGGTANVTIADVRQSNGVIHVVDSVLLPN